jgi:hypothetical protein
MGQPFGRNTPLPNTGVPIFALADTITYVPVAGGITIDWATVAAVGTDTVTSTPEGITVKAGQKFLRYGQVLTKITASGKWGPYDPGAADGRQTLARGNVCVLNETLLENGILGFTNRQTNHPLVFVGGLAFKARLLATTGAASLAAGPTFATLEPVLPQLRYAQF